MTNGPVFVLANLLVTDGAEYRKYEKGFFPLLQRYGGEFLTYDDNPIHFEGGSERKGRMILFSFPSKQHAQDWYNDPEYQEISESRRAGTRLEFLTMLHANPSKKN